MDVPTRTWVSAVALVLPALAVSTACGAPDPDHPAGEAHGLRCQQFESFSGRLLVGDSPSLPTVPDVVPTLPTVPDVVPVEPGAQPSPAPVLPTLDSIEIEPTAAADTIVFGLGGDGSMGWSARFVQMPLLHGTDEPVSISGACVLQIDLTGVDSNIDSLRREVPMRISPEGEASSVVEVLGYPSGSALVQSFVGTRSGTPTVTVEASVDRTAITVAISS
ncbi:MULTISPECIES: hypothetical protein [Rhodococcus]|uniref:AMIN-like domain-containing (lipo)protein n=1 Tax=Rhodococcus TaxID=1827 RepID=UPI000BE441C6|nr:MULTISPECIES: hypothetical protein [Rhodococcus]MBP1162152.1 hypothetical protein [Rhodococcus sp. PvR099]MCZ4558012.1 hypothetical protein [Rhodococcus maanshanensis]